MNNGCASHTCTPAVDFTTKLSLLPSLSPGLLAYLSTCLLNLHHHRRVLPQLFEVVEAASRRVKYMNYDITEVDQRPAGITATFRGMQRQQASLLLQFHNDRVYDSLGLARALRRAQHEIVRQDGDLAQVQQGNIQRLFVFN